MYAKLLKKIIFMSKYSALGFVLQCLLFTVILAEDGKTQGVNLNDAYVSLDLNKNSNEEAFSEEEIADVEISGKITDENGEGLPGASILIKGKAQGTTTNLEGEYKLTVPDDAVLEISYVGYSSQDIVLGAQSVIDVQLVPDAAQLDEIVVVGYGTVKKRDLTGSVGSLTQRKLLINLLTL